MYEFYMQMEVFLHFTQVGEFLSFLDCVINF